MGKLSKCALNFSNAVFFSLALYDLSIATNSHFDIAACCGWWYNGTTQTKTAAMPLILERPPVDFAGLVDVSLFCSILP
jgi:hypothetical protein